ncbi:MAG: right-handed parallel beta-helix repeat-containing protein, partial [Candidatus ainarchaeum sp.]|nr:right-handed parallel beta-helix repeat-containing protein [Candidatus ainarchaeum sp.]
MSLFRNFSLLLFVLVLMSAASARECVDLPLLISHISGWKAGNIAMPALSQKISEWKSGAACPQAACGNNILEGSEICDGTDLNMQTCATQGFAGGTLGCDANCLSFNKSLCTTASEKTFYIAGAVSGSDSYTGECGTKDPASNCGPWATIGKAGAEIAAGRISAGDNVLLKKGEIFTAHVYFDAFAGTKQKPISFGAYGTGSRPEIRETGIADDAIFYLRDMPAGSGIVLRDIYFHRTSQSETAITSHYSGGIRQPNISIINCEVEGGSDALQIQDSCASLLVEGAKIHGALNTGLLAGCSNATVKNSEFYSNGYQSIYLDGTAAQDILIENNNIHDSITCFAAHGAKTGLTVRNNSIHNCNFGAGIYPAYGPKGAPEKFENVAIENNTFYNMQKISLSYDSWELKIGSCANCIVRNNIFRDNASAGLFVVDGNADDAPNNGILIYNNTFYNNSVPAE